MSKFFSVKPRIIRRSADMLSFKAFLKKAMHFSSSDPSSNVQNLACFCQKSGALYLGEELVGLKGLSHERLQIHLDNNN